MVIFGDHKKGYKMTLIEQLTEIFKEALTKVFKLESEKNPWYLRQTILGCRWRAFVGITLAIHYAKGDLVKLLALAIAKHRSEEHNDNKEKTISTLSKSLDMSVDEVKSSAFWSQ